MDIIEPCGFIDFATLQKNSSLIITDSGGVQKEAYFYRKPCITLREETEWPELVNSGWNKLIQNFDKNHIFKAIEIQSALDPHTPRTNFYGNGDTAKKIISNLVDAYL